MPILGLSYRQFLAHARRAYWLEIMEESKGDLGRAGTLSGVTYQQTLRRELREAGVWRSAKRGPKGSNKVIVDVKHDPPVPIEFLEWLKKGVRHEQRTSETEIRAGDREGFDPGTIQERVTGLSGRWKGVRESEGEIPNARPEEVT